MCRSLLTSFLSPFFLLSHTHFFDKRFWTTAVGKIKRRQTTKFRINKAVKSGWFRNWNGSLCFCFEMAIWNVDCNNTHHFFVYALLFVKVPAYSVMLKCNSILIIVSAYFRTHLWVSQFCIKIEAKALRKKRGPRQTIFQDTSALHSVPDCMHSFRTQVN